MLSFECDYNNGACPEVMAGIVAHNDERTATYGADHFSLHAKQLIAQACGLEDAQVFLLTGGTQTNSTVIDSMLGQCEGVVCADTGHINVHEAGAIELTGHKVIALPGKDGKLEAKVLDDFMADFTADESREHVVQPGLVYITFPTELGTIYTAAELDALFQTCRRHQLPLFIDGARLGYGLAAEGCDVTLPYLASRCDAFYVGGTKVGALCGEAVVFTHANANRHFFSIQKQHGAVLAKGRLTGLQFEALFQPSAQSADGELVYMRLARHAISMASRMKALFRRKGYDFYIDSPTNQQFIVIPDEEAERLARQVEFTHWGHTADHRTICRFVTSWATTDDELHQLEQIVG